MVKLNEVFWYLKKKVWLSEKLAFPDSKTDKRILVFRKVVILH